MLRSGDDRCCIKDRRQAVVVEGSAIQREQQKSVF